MTILNLRSFLFCCALCCIVSTAFAEEKTNASYWDVSGYIDASYNYLTESNRFTSSDYNRLNDLSPNGITLQQATLIMQHLPDQGLGQYFKIMVGRDAYAFTPNGVNADMLGIQTIGVTVPEAYLQFKKSKSNFQVGLLQTLSGYEQMEYPQNPLFSGSILYGYAQPGAHMGGRFTQTISDQLSFYAGISNGWNTIKLPGQLHTFELGVTYTPVPAFSLTVDGYSGQEHLTDSTTDGRTHNLSLFDTYATLNVTQKLSFTLNYDYARQERARLPRQPNGRAIWQGVAGYVSYKLNEKWITNARAELFDDSNGFRTGVRQNWREATIALAYLPTKNWLFRIETRHDISNKSSFVNKSGGGTNHNQQSYSFDVLYQF